MQVLCLAPFDTEAEAIALANDSDYGLTSYVQTADAARARRVSRALRAGMVEVNGKVCWRRAPNPDHADPDPDHLPFPH